MKAQTNCPASMKRSGSALTVFTLMAFSPLSVQAETTQCTEIVSLPATLSAQGIYCLKHDLSTNMTDGNAITIANSNITVDFNGFKLSGIAAGVGTGANGVYALNRKNISLRNGIIRGFRYGVFLDDSDLDFSNTGGHRLYDLVLDNNRYAAALVKGTGNSIYNNRVSNTGGSVLGSSAFGVFNNGPSANITGNFISSTLAGAGAASYGITSSGGTAVIRGNQVTETLFGGGGSGYGIWVSGTGASSVIENNAVLNQTAVANSSGISTGNGAVNACMNNRVAGFNSAITICKDGGGNVTF